MDKPANIEYTIDQFRKFIISFQKEISIHNEETSLIGHSLGGYIASEIAIQHKKSYQSTCSNRLFRNVESTYSHS